MPQKSRTAIAVIGIDIGKNSFHVVGHDGKGAIVLRQKWSRGQVEARLAKCRHAWWGWRPASVPTISAAASRRSDMMLG